MSDRIERLQRMLASDPNDPFCLYALGMEFSATNAYESAAAHLEASLKFDPNQPYAHFHRARALAAMGRSQDAAAAVEAGRQCAEEIGDHHAAEELAALAQTLPPTS